MTFCATLPIGAPFLGRLPTKNRLLHGPPHRSVYRIEPLE